jgi:hypothetical protein
MKISEMARENANAQVVSGFVRGIYSIDSLFAHHMNMKRICVSGVLAAATFLSIHALPQIIDVREVGGKRTTCMHSGLSSNLEDCGAPDWYAYVFVGSISAITPAANDEKTIEVIPEDVFKGEPPNPLTVLTSQAACLPSMNVGDRWLFFLRTEKGKPIVLDYYGNDSIPVRDAQDQIETLRRLRGIGDFGILRGRVIRGTSVEAQPVPAANVVAHQLAGHEQFVARTDDQGRFEFQPLSPGRYKLIVDPIGSFRPDDSEIDVKRGGCWGLTLLKSPHAQLSGHVRHSDGSPVLGMGVLLTSDDGSGWIIRNVDAHGLFQFESLRPGKYVIGINLPNAPPWKYGGAGGGGNPPTAFLYYPGVPDRASALIINLAEDEKRSELDFIIPRQ